MNWSRCGPSPTLQHQWEKQYHLIKERGIFCRHCLMPYSAYKILLRNNPDHKGRPLRKIIRHTPYYDYLECGHSLPAAQDIFGPRFPQKRRCGHCAKVAAGTYIECPECDGSGEGDWGVLNRCQACTGFGLKKIF